MFDRRKGRDPGRDSGDERNGRSAPKGKRKRTPARQETRKRRR
eukprot:IDg13761t1